MSMGRDLTIERAVELWRDTFGEPPSILAEPAEMLALIESHTAGSVLAAASGEGPEARN